LVGNEVISPKGWLEPPLARSNFNRFLQKTLELLAETKATGRGTEPVSDPNSEWWRRRELNPD
jgi:hypothetical protein